MEEFGDFLYQALIIAISGSLVVAAWQLWKKKKGLIPRIAASFIALVGAITMFVNFGELLGSVTWLSNFDATSIIEDILGGLWVMFERIFD